jgi:uncharacterized repeat protein (TIGR01451 family)
MPERITTDVPDHRQRYQRHRLPGDLGGPDDGVHEVTITIHVFVTAETARWTTWRASIRTIRSSNPTSSTTARIRIVRRPADAEVADILVSKRSTRRRRRQVQLTYTITISNVGTAKAQAGWLHRLTLADTLSNQLVFTSFTTTNGWTCLEAPAGTITCHDDGTGMDVGLRTGDHPCARQDTANVPISNTATAALARVDGGQRPGRMCERSARETSQTTPPPWSLPLDRPGSTCRSVRLPTLPIRSIRLGV